MATTDFEVRQLLKAYRKGLISDELFAEQMKDLNGAHRYAYNGTTHTTESEMIMHLLDEFRSGENFASEYLNRWIAVSDQECVRGGLRTVQQRETFHAQLLEARLRQRDNLQKERSARFVRLGSSLAENEDESAIVAMLLDDYYQQTLHAPVVQPASPREESQQRKPPPSNHSRRRRRR